MLQALITTETQVIVVGTVSVDDEQIQSDSYALIVHFFVIGTCSRC